MATVAETLGLDKATVYRYVRVFATLGVDQYLAHEHTGYWSLLTSVQLAHLCQQVNATLNTDCQDVREGLLRTYQVHYSRSGLTSPLHWLGFTYKLTTLVPCQADAIVQADFLDELTVLETYVERGEAVLYYADAVHPTMSPIASTSKARGACMSSYWPSNQISPISTSCAPRPATTKIRSCGSGWLTNPFAKCFCPRICPTQI